MAAGDRGSWGRGGGAGGDATGCILELRMGVGRVVSWREEPARRGAGSTWIGWGTFERMSRASSLDIWRAWSR